MTQLNATNDAVLRSQSARPVGSDDQLAVALTPEILGSLNVGALTALVGSPMGILLSLQSQPMTLVPRSWPILQIPPVPGRFVGRQLALAQAVEAVHQKRSLEVYAPAGTGKSVFVRQLAHQAEITTSHPDGILYLTQLEPFADVLHRVGEMFYHLYPDSYLPDAEWQQALQDVHALVIVNAPNCRVDSIQALQQLLPESTLIVASHHRRSVALGEDWQSIGLDRLSWDDCLQLVEQIQEQALSAVDQAIVKALWQRFDGAVVRLVQLAELAKQGQMPWSQWQVWLANAAPKDDPSAYLVEQLVATLSTPQRWILGLLCALEGVSLRSTQIAGITGPQDPLPSLQGLVRLGLVRVTAGRYGIADHMQTWLASEFESQPWMERGLVVLQDWAAEQPPEALLPELPVLMAFLRWAVAQKQAAVVLSLARSLDTALVLGKRWEEWGRVLQWALQAAWQLEDQAAEAWAWHQLGVRSLLLEDVTTAYDALQQSLRLRRGLDDALGVALTQRNLSYLMRGTVPLEQRQEIRAEQSRHRTYWTLAVLSIVTFCLALGVGSLVRGWLAPDETVLPAQSVPAQSSR
jgi:hypothetical protein